MNKKLIILIILIALIAYILGFAYGITYATNYGLKIFHSLTERGLVNISISDEMIRTGLWQYKNNIGGCLFTGDNALILPN